MGTVHDFNLRLLGSSSTTSAETPFDLMGDLDAYTEILSEGPHCARILLELASDKDDISPVLKNDSRQYYGYDD